MTRARTTPLMLALTWRSLLGATGGLLLAVVLATVVLALGANAADVIDQDTSSGTALGLALLPTLGLVAAALVGAACGISVIAAMVRDVLTGQRPLLTASWGRAWAALPGLLALGVVSAIALAGTVVGWSVLTAAVLLRAGWRLRSATTRRTARDGLWWAVPGAPALAVVAAFPSTWSALLSGTGLRDALRENLRTPFRDRVRVLAGLLVLGLVSWALGTAGLAISEATASADPGRFAVGTAALGVTTTILVILAGALLGLLAHRRGDDPTPSRSTPGHLDPAAFPRRRFWRGARVTATAAMLSATVLLPTPMTGAVGVPAAADSATALRVTTLEDSGTPADGECVEADVPCGVRTALVIAETLTSAGEQVTVDFDATGTVTLADTLRIPAGVTITAAGVTFDAHQGFRAVEAFSVQEESGARITLRGLTITGGRADRGAGVFSDNVNVDLDQVELRDNVSTAGDGGAVAVPYVTLTVTDSLFVDNHARAGVGGAASAMTLNWTNSTAVNNTGSASRPRGGALYAEYGGRISHATVIGGGGVAGDQWADLAVSNSAISTSTGTGALPCAYLTDPADPEAPSTGNVDATGTCLGTEADLAPLGELADNGGPTRTVALLPGSAAIGAADAGLCAATDQRGTARTATDCDAGAFQTSGAVVPPVDVVPVDVSVQAPTTVRAGSPVTVVVRLASTAAVPAGTVTVRVDGDPVAEQLPVTANEASASTGPLAQGPHVIRAEFVPADRTPVHVSEPVTVSAQATTTLTVTADEDDVAVGAPVTVRATLTSPDEAPGTPAFTGTVTFTAGDTTHTSPVDADGVATWRPTALPAAVVAAAYDGDGHHGAARTSAKVTTGADPSATTITVTPTTSAFGEAVTITGTLSDPASGDPLAGDVTLVVDGTRDVDTTAGADGAFSFVKTFGPGPHEISATGTPSAVGWAASTSAPTSIEVTAAEAEVSLTLDPATSTYPDMVTAHATATGAGVDTFELLLDGDVVETATFTLTDENNLHAEHYFTLYPGALKAGTHEVTVRIPASSTTAGAQDSATATVARAATALTLSDLSPTSVGGTLSLDVTVDGGWDANGVVTITDQAGRTVATGDLTSSAASLSWVATRAGTQELSVSFDPASDDSHLPSSARTSVDVAGLDAPEPTLTWSDPVATGATLRVEFPASDAVVTGRVDLVDLALGIVGTAELVDGVATVTLDAPAGECYCGGRLLLQYVGDDTYQPSTTPVPDVTLPSHETGVTFGYLPDSIGFDQTLYLNATVAAASGSEPPSGSLVFSVNGTDIATVTLRPDGSAFYAYDLSQVADPAQRLHVDALYVPDAPRWQPSTADQAIVRLEATVEPTVVLTRDSARPTVGRTSVLTVTAGAGSEHIAVGSRVSVLDQWDNVLGDATWTSDAGLKVARVSVTWARGGPQQVAAYYGYGSNLGGSSRPLDVTVAGTAPTFVITGESYPVVGRPMPVTVTLDNPGLENAGMPLELIVDGKVIDSATMEPGRRSHTFTVNPRDRYRTTYQVQTTGDGRDFASGIGQGAITAHGVFTSVSTDRFTRVPYGPAWTMDLDLTHQRADQPDATGFVRLTVHNAAGQLVTGCALLLPETRCEFGGWNLAVGTYSVEASYDGDAIHEPSKMVPAGTLIVDPTLASLRVSYDPDPNQWLVGQRVRATFVATDPQTATPSGNVVLTQSGAGTLCNVPATTGGCSFTVPDNTQPLDRRSSTALVATYAPTSGTQPATHNRSASRVRYCLRVSTGITAATPNMGSLPDPTISGERCSVPGVAGYLEGTDVTLTVNDTLRAGYRTTAWTEEVKGVSKVNRIPRGHYPVWNTRVLSDVHVYPTIGWDPTCVTLTTGNERLQPRSVYEGDPRYYDPGHLEILTPSNCALPRGESPAESRDREYDGIGRFVVGTVVEVRPFAYRNSGATISDPEHTPIDVPNTDAPNAAYSHPHVTLTKDQFLFARFRLSSQMCTPTRLHAGDGGALALVGSKVSSQSDFWYDDRQGHCLTADGTPGYLAGTELSLKATPSNSRTGAPAGQPRAKEFFNDRWLEDGDLDSPTVRAASLAATSYGRNPAPIDGYDPYLPVAHTVTVPMAGSRTVVNYGAAFGNISCSQVSVDVTYPVLSGNDTTQPNVELTPSNCPAEASSGPGRSEPRPDKNQPYFNWQPNYAGQLVRSEEQVRWYTPGTRVRASTTRTTLPDRRGTRKLTWTLGNGTDELLRSEGALLETVVEAGKNLRIEGQYVSSHCRAPRVKVYPAGIGLGYDIDDSGSCPQGLADTTKLTGLYASQANHRLKAVWEVAGSPQDVPMQAGRVLTGSYPVVVGPELVYQDIGPDSGAHTRPVSLHYCARLDVKVKVVDLNDKPLREFTDAATARTYNAPKADQILTDNDPCPAPLMAHPGTTVRFGASGALGRKWEVTGIFRGANLVTAVPAQKVAIDGTTSDGHTVVVTPRCVHLDAGSKVGVTTAVNCPGATQESRLFLVGTPVTLKFTGDSSQFDKWHGTDASKDTAAVVVMNGDRTVTAGFHDPHALEIVINVLTALEQTAISYLITAATGAATGLLFIAQVGALAVIGIAHVLEAAGVSGSFLVTMKDTGETIQAGLAVVNSLADCTNEWATGGASPPLSPSGYQSEEIISVGTGLYDEYGNETVSEALGTAGSAVDLVNLFAAGGLSRYARDAGESWAGIVDIGSCIRDSGLAVRDAGSRLGR